MNDYNTANSVCVSNFKGWDMELKTIKMGYKNLHYKSVLLYSNFRIPRINTVNDKKQEKSFAVFLQELESFPDECSVEQWFLHFPYR